MIAFKSQSTHHQTRKIRAQIAAVEALKSFGEDAYFESDNAGMRITITRGARLFSFYDGHWSLDGDKRDDSFQADLVTEGNGSESVYVNVESIDTGDVLIDWTNVRAIVNAIRKTIRSTEVVASRL